MRSRNILINLGFCVLIFSAFLFKYVDKLNYLTKLKLQLPKIEREIKDLFEKNTKLRYEIDKFENPNNLMELARKEQFSHLKHPLVKDVLKIKEGVALNNNFSDK